MAPKLEDRTGDSWRPHHWRACVAPSRWQAFTTLPIALSDGSPFPARDLAIFLAMGVIIVSLIAASVRLPLLLRGLKMPDEPSYQAEEDRARVAAAGLRLLRSSVSSISSQPAAKDADVYMAAAARVMDFYRNQH